MRSDVLEALASRDPVAVENSAFPGTPDVNYIDGWLELKQLERWPRNADVSPVLINHYTQEQRVWILKRWSKNGVVGLLLKVGNEYLLFDGGEAYARVGRVARPDLLRHAVARWSSKKEMQEGLLSCLSNMRASLRRSG